METKDDMDLYPEYNVDDDNVLEDDCGERHTPEDLPDDQYRSSSEDRCVQSDPDFHENNIDNDTIESVRLRDTKREIFHQIHQKDG